MTGLHCDDEDNVLVQVSGRKRVTLVPPWQRHCCYPNRKYDEGTTCCDADAEAATGVRGGGARREAIARHPALAGAAARSVVLEAGDVLFIPRYWFHQVRPLRCVVNRTGGGEPAVVSISLNFFVSTPWQLLREGLPRWALNAAHRWLRWRRGCCVCHATHCVATLPG